MGNLTSIVYLIHIIIIFMCPMCVILDYCFLLIIIFIIIHNNIVQINAGGELNFCSAYQGSYFVY